MDDALGPVPATVPPEPGALLAALAAMLGGDDLRVIAEADYGSDVDDHLAALHAIARGGVVPRPLEWCPHEVLSLVHWDQPPPEPAGEQRLWRHAFSCCALLRAYGDPESSLHMFDQDPTLAGLMTSLHDLAALPLPRAKRQALAAMDRQAAALLAWLTPRVADFGEPDFFGLTLLWFGLAAGVPASSLAALVDWIMRAEAVSDGWAREIYGRRDAPRIWLLGRSGGSMREHGWRRIGALLPGRLLPQHGAEVAEGVRRISRLLAPQTLLDPQMP